MSGQDSDRPRTEMIIKYGICHQRSSIVFFNLTTIRTHISCIHTSTVFILLFSDLQCHDHNLILSTYILSNFLVRKYYVNKEPSRRNQDTKSGISCKVTSQEHHKRKMSVQAVDFQCFFNLNRMRRMTILFGLVSN